MSAGSVGRLHPQNGPEFGYCARRCPLLKIEVPGKLMQGGIKRVHVKAASQRLESARLVTDAQFQRCEALQRFYLCFIDPSQAVELIRLLLLLRARLVDVRKLDIGITLPSVIREERLGPRVMFYGMLDVSLALADPPKSQMCEVVVRVLVEPSLHRLLG